MPTYCSPTTRYPPKAPLPPEYPLVNLREGSPTHSLHRWEVSPAPAALQAPSTEGLPSLRAWRPADAALAWKYNRKDKALEVHGFGGPLKCVAYTGDPGALVPDPSATGWSVGLSFGGWGWVEGEGRCCVHVSMGIAANQWRCGR